MSILLFSKIQKAKTHFSFESSFSMKKPDERDVSAGLLYSVAAKRRLIFNRYFTRTASRRRAPYLSVFRIANLMLCSFLTLIGSILFRL